MRVLAACITRACVRGTPPLCMSVPTEPTQETMATGPSALDIVLITGMSGSGKSVGLRALEDAGYYCVDNLPPELLGNLIELEMGRASGKLAIAIDVRRAQALPNVPMQLSALRLGHKVKLKVLFLEASNDVLLRRFSETRRSHPLTTLGPSTDGESYAPQGLQEAILYERELLANLRDQSHVIDTSFLRPAQLQAFVKTFVEIPAAQLVLVFESFAFKRGIPVDADFVFDARMLPNPHYEANLRPLTGKDTPVAAFLYAQPEVGRMLENIESFIRSWLPAMGRDHRSYVTVAIGCTGGQHRSVYLVERLSERFAQDALPHWVVLARHREVHFVPTPAAALP